MQILVVRQRPFGCEGEGEICRYLLYFRHIPIAHTPPIHPTSAGNCLYRYSMSEIPLSRKSKYDITLTELIRMARNSSIWSCRSLGRAYLIMLSFLIRILPSDLVCGAAFTKDVSNLVRSYKISLRSCGIQHDRSFRSYLILARPDKILT